MLAAIIAYPCSRFRSRTAAALGNGRKLNDFQCSE